MGRGTVTIMIDLFDIIYTSVKNLAGTDYAFLSSFFVLIFTTHIFIKNIMKGLRSCKVFYTSSMIFLYCILYQSGTIRWEYMGYITNTAPFDNTLWMCIDTFCFIILFHYLWNINRIMKKCIRLKSRQCEMLD